MGSAAPPSLSSRLAGGSAAKPIEQLLATYDRLADRQPAPSNIAPVASVAIAIPIARPPARVSGRRGTSASLPLRIIDNLLLVRMVSGTIHGGKVWLTPSIR